MTTNNVRAIFMPYCIQRQPCGGYIVLNRKYAPLGVSKPDAPRPAEIIYKLRMSAATARTLSHNGSEDTDCVYLYDDSCTPDSSKYNWDMYQEKLHHLHTLQITN